MLVTIHGLTVWVIWMSLKAKLHASALSVAMKTGGKGRFLRKCVPLRPQFRHHLPSPPVRLDRALMAVSSSLINLFFTAVLPLVWDGLKHCSTPLTKAPVSEITRSTWSTRGSGVAV